MITNQARITALQSRFGPVIVFHPGGIKGNIQVQSNTADSIVLGIPEAGNTIVSIVPPGFAPPFNLNDLPAIPPALFPRYYFPSSPSFPVTMDPLPGSSGFDLSGNQNASNDVSFPDGSAGSLSVPQATVTLAGEGGIPLPSGETESAGTVTFPESTGTISFPQNNGITVSLIPEGGFAVFIPSGLRVNPFVVSSIEGSNGVPDKHLVSFQAQTRVYLPVSGSHNICAQPADLPHITNSIRNRVLALKHAASLTLAFPHFPYTIAGNRMAYQDKTDIEINLHEASPVDTFVRTGFM